MMAMVLGVVAVSVSREDRFRKISQVDRPDRSSQNERRSPSSSKNLILLVESEHRKVWMLASGSHGREEYPCRDFVSYRVSWKQLRLVSIARPPRTIPSPRRFFLFRFVSTVSTMRPFYSAISFTSDENRRHSRRIEDPSHRREREFVIVDVNVGRVISHRWVCSDGRLLCD